MTLYEINDRDMQGSMIEIVMLLKDKINEIIEEIRYMKEEIERIEEDRRI